MSFAQITRYFSFRATYLMYQFVFINGCVILHDMSWYTRVAQKNVPNFA